MNLDLSTSLAILVISGDSVAQFLQSQLTQNINARNANQLQWQAYCSRDGFVQSLFGLWEQDQKFYCLLPKILAAPTLALIQKYGAFSKITTQILTGKNIFLEITPAEQVNWIWDIASPLTDAIHFRWSTSARDIPPMIAEDQLRDLFIQHAFPWLNGNTAGKFRPHDLNFPALGLVSFDKGCFPGQEIIARTQYRGKPKSSFRAYRLNGLHPFTSGAGLLDGDKVIGTVLDVIYGADFTDLSCVLQNDQEMHDVRDIFPL